MTNFKDLEVDTMQNGGNAKAEQTYRARWSEKEAPKPKVTDEQAVKNFIYKTYVKKIWYDESGAKNDVPPVRPIQQIIENPTKIEVEKTTGTARGRTNSSATSQKTDIFSFTSDEPKQPPKVQTKVPAKSSGGLEEFFSFDTPQQSNGGSGGFGGDDFQADFPDDNATNTTTTPQQKRGIDLDSLFKNVTTTAGPSNQFGGNQFGGGFGQQQNQFGGGFGQQAPNQFGQQGNQFGGGFGGQQNQFGGGYGQQAPNQFGGQQQHPQQQQQFGGGYGQQAPNQFGGQQQQYPPQQQQFGGGYGQQQQFGGQYPQTGHQGPVLNPLLANTPQQKNDPNDHLFSDLGPMKPSQPKSQPQPQPTWNQPTTSHADDNPFDF
jgi:hypothetical protein